MTSVDKTWLIELMRQSSKLPLRTRLEMRVFTVKRQSSVTPRCLTVRRWNRCTTYSQTVGERRRESAILSPLCTFRLPNKRNSLLQAEMKVSQALFYTDRKHRVDPNKYVGSVWKRSIVVFDKSNERVDSANILHVLKYNKAKFVSFGTWQVKPSTVRNSVIKEMMR